MRRVKRLTSEILRPRRHIESSGIATNYQSICEKEHERELDLDDLAIMVDSNFECGAEDEDGNACTARVESLGPENIRMECQFCGYVDTFPWEELDQTCCQ